MGQMNHLHDQDGFYLEGLALEDIVSWKSWVWHKCKKARRIREQEWMLVDCLGKEVCDFCQAPAPPEIMALWKLHNFDFIQKESPWGVIW